MMKEQSYLCVKRNKLTIGTYSLKTVQMLFFGNRIMIGRIHGTKTQF